jgi:hypothetical protein
LWDLKVRHCYEDVGKKKASQRFASFLHVFLIPPLTFCHSLIREEIKNRNRNRDKEEENGKAEEMIKYRTQGNIGKYKSTIEKEKTRNMRMPVVCLSSELSAL